jgi:diguanylate cyclase (GGDEF)-like protein
MDRKHGDQDTTATLADMWGQFKDAELARVDTLDRAALALLRGSLVDDQRLQATREAHQLAGAVGTFGFMQASSTAREIEQILQGTVTLGEAQVGRLSTLVVRLRTELERDPAATTSPEPRAAERLSVERVPCRESPFLLLVDDDPALAERICEEGATRYFHTEVAEGVEAARSVLARERPDVVLLDLLVQDTTEDGLGLLKELNEQGDPVPVLVLTRRDTFIDRVQVATLGGRGFLSKSTPTSEVFDAVVRLLQQHQPGESRVIAADDDPVILATLDFLLSPCGIRVIPVNDPLSFWDMLEQQSPDLVILDVDMPRISGIELCQVMRNDERWSTTPVVFLTARTDPETVRQVFAAGADDFVNKPIVGPELIARITNRLERSRLARSMAETDPLTGLANRRKASESVGRFLRLAERHDQPLSIAVLDIDHFKQVNDRYGHDTGDAVLQGITKLLLQGQRGEDIVARWGGEEILLAMYGMTRADGVQRLANVLETVRDETFMAPNGDAIRVTFSGGVSQFPEDGADLQTLCRAADEALYRAKAAGRNRVVPAGWRAPESEGQTALHADVVVVDGDEVLGGLLIHSLETRGYLTRWLKDGAMAAAMLGGANPALQARTIVLDVDLPGLNGLDVLRHLADAGITQRSRIIMLTARPGESEIVEALEMGACDHVAKPFSLPVLMQRIRRALEVA